MENKIPPIRLIKKTIKSIRLTVFIFIKLFKKLPSENIKIANIKKSVK